VAHELRPEQAEFEAQHRARHRSDGEQDRRALGPALGQLEQGRVTASLVSPLGQDHQQRHRHAGDREQNVEGQRERHLAARGEQVGHRAALL
jgi:hypothetical protein